MRRNLWLLGVFSLLLVAAPSSFGESCSCTAPDGSCSASVSCSGGCMAICGSGGNCSASCSGGGGKPQQEHQGLRTEPGAIGVTPGSPAEGVQRVSVEAHDLVADDVSTLLSSLADREITFVPNIVGERLSITAKDFPVGQLIAGVAEYGAVGDHPRRLVTGHSRLDERVSLQAKKVTAEALAGMVESLSGGRAVFVPADPDAPISMEVKGMRLDELLSHLTAFGEVLVDGQSVDRQ